jgi:hypothetical protein
LTKYGIKGVTHKWFASYLKDRQQKVDINGSYSSTKTFNISVIQGSILGPILFLIYINDLYSASELLKIMFADDTACLASNANLNELVKFVNQELKRVARWFRSNKIAVIVSKTKFIIFHTKGKQVDNNIELTYDDNEPNQQDPTLISTVSQIYSNHHDKQSRAYKLLGIYLDDNLSFDFHTQHLLSKLNRSLYCINRAKNFLTKQALKSLYFALIHSHLTYCPTIISCFTTQNLNKLFLVQKKAIRTISQQNYNAHTAPLFRELNILPLHSQLQFSKSLLMHSIIYNYSPKSFKGIWTTNREQTEIYELRNNDQLTLPYPRIELFKRSPLYTLPLLWNQLDAIKLQHNRTTFKIALREKLLS